MRHDIPGIESVSILPPSTLRVRWRDGAVDDVDLFNWIALGGNTLAPLRRTVTFAKATVSERGTSVTWDGGEGDLSIDTYHLKLIAEKQRHR
jgi:hypothetical protein